MADEDEFRGGAFWRVVGLRAVGACVVTAADARGPQGFLALSVAHVSDDPPLMSVAVGKQTSALATILSAGCYAINILAADQEPLADAFGGRTTFKGADRFTLGEWDILTTGAPALLGGVGVIDCRLETTADLGAAVIAVGRVVGFRPGEVSEPLVYFRGSRLR